MAGKAESSHVIQVTLASTFGDGEDMICVPEGTAARDVGHAVEREAGSASETTRAFQRGVNGDRVRLTKGADAAIPGKDLVAEITGVGAEAVLVNAEIRTEGSAATGENFEFAPAAEGSTKGTAGENLGLDSATGEGAGEGHGIFENKARFRG